MEAHYKLYHKFNVFKLGLVSLNLGKYGKVGLENVKNLVTGIC